MKNYPRWLLVSLALIAPVFAQTKIEPPVPVRMVAPDYPEKLKQDGIMGLVVVNCTVDVQGNVVGPAVEKSSNAGFDQPALDAVKKWKFKPAQQDGKPIAKKVSIPIKFVAES